MSQYPSAPPPGAYVAANSTQPAQNFNPQQHAQYGYQQPQAPSPYGNPAPSYGSSSSHKSTNAFGQAFDQAVKQGKPMFNKLGKTISSKLGNKPSTTTPQHLESYNNYQQHQHQHPPSQQQQNPYASPQQQSPYPQSNYATPAPGQAGQNNYFGQQPPPPLPNTPAPQSQANIGYDPNVFTQGGHAGGQDQGQPPQGAYSQGQAPFHQTQAGLNSGQQTGIVGGSQAPLPFNNPPSSQSQSTSSSQFTPQPTTQQRPWSPQSHSQYAGQTTSPSPAIQQQQWAPQQPQHPQQPQQPQAPGPIQQQPFDPTPPPQQYNSPPPAPVHPNQQQPAQQQWAPTSPVSSRVQAHSPIPPPVSPLQPSQVQQQPPTNAPPEPQKQSKPPTPTPAPAPQVTQAEAGPTEFIAELPADLANLSLTEVSKPSSPSNASASSSYQAFRPAGTSQSPGPGFTVPRRALSMSSIPLADPWRFADAATELPTREFYIIADLMYDAMDRRFAPRNTGLLEASKMLESWKALGLTEEAAELFAYDNYSAFAKLWSLEEIAHVMVPCQAALTPVWNFQPQSHSEAIKIPMGSILANPIRATYQPALNRAGYYKYFFLEMMHEPESLEKMLSTFCGDSYKPGVLNQPDVQKRDRTVLHGLAAQAATIRSACISCVSQETAALMQKALEAVQAQPQPQPHSQVANPIQATGATSPSPPNASVPAQGDAPMTDEERLVKMHSLKMQSQFNHMMATTMLGAGHVYGGPNYGSLV